jgi:sugar/nucleoside kinase (ribokinase family)
MSALGSAETGAVNVVGFGAGALDLFRLPGEIGADHNPGAKIGWDPETQILFDSLLNNPEYSSRLRVGGNVINLLAYFALDPRIMTLFAGVLGRDDPASVAIRTDLELFGISNKAVEVPGYLPSVSLIERDIRPGSDRMVRGRPRDPMDRYLTPDYLQEVASLAHIAVVSSIKSTPLTKSIFDATPSTARLSYNPGSSEFSRSTDILRLMAHRNPDLFAANIDELQMLFPTITAETPEKLAAKLASAAGKYAVHVLCTLGSEGALLAYNGGVEIIRQQGQRVPDEAVVDTLGAGDRAHATMAGQLFVEDARPEAALQKVVDNAGTVVQHLGAHGDLYALVA